MIQGMIFAAGLGSRLRPLTDSCPKPLLEVGGATMLARVINRMKSVGIDHIVINVHHLSQMIVDYVGRNDNFGITIRFSDESDHLLDTGGGLLRAAPLFRPGLPILIYNADILSDFPIGEMISAHTASEADVTLLAARRPTSRYLLFDSSNCLRAWTDTRTGEVRPAEADVATLHPLAFGGVHLIEYKVLESLRTYASGRDAFPIIPFYLAASTSQSINAFTPSAPFHWFDIGKPETLDAARKVFEK